MIETINRMKIQGLFLDFDGTISPLNASREEARIPLATESVLYRISRLVPVAIITTKDMSFIMPRTPFAVVWCAVGGLEINAGREIITDPCVEAALPYISMAFQFSRLQGDIYLYVEEKEDSKGRTLAFCVDWRRSPDTKEAEIRVAKILSGCRRPPLNVIEYPGQPFFDVYPCPVNKGKTLAELKRILGIHAGTMYLGDSKVDNPAFKAADIGIGVLHGSSPGELLCDYSIEFEEVAAFFTRLIENNMVFTADLPGILRKGSGNA